LGGSLRANGPANDPANTPAHTTANDLPSARTFGAKHSRGLPPNRSCMSRMAAAIGQTAPAYAPANPLSALAQHPTQRQTRAVQFSVFTVQVNMIAARATRPLTVDR